MDDFLSHLAEKSVGTTAVIQPRPISLFEAAPPVAELPQSPVIMEMAQDTTTHPASTAQRLNTPAAISLPPRPLPPTMLVAPEMDAAPLTRPLAAQTDRQPSPLFSNDADALELLTKRPLLPTKPENSLPQPALADKVILPRPASPPADPLPTRKNAPRTPDQTAEMQSAADQSPVEELTEAAKVAVSVQTVMPMKEAVPEKKAAPKKVVTPAKTAKPTTAATLVDANVSPHIAQTPPKSTLIPVSQPLPAQPPPVIPVESLVVTDNKATTAVSVILPANPFSPSAASPLPEPDVVRQTATRQTVSERPLSVATPVAAPHPPNLTRQTSERPFITATAVLQPAVTLYQPPAPQTAASIPSTPAPTVEVHIGRIEVRAAPPPASPSPLPPAAPLIMSLEDYLRQRDNGGAS